MNDTIRKIANDMRARGVVQRPLVAARIAVEAAKQHGVSVEDMASSSVQSQLVAARWLAAHHMHEAGMSTVQIGAALNRDHSTIIHALRRMATRS